MFQSLRGGAPIYLLNKTDLKLSIGEVISIGPVVPQFGTTYQNGMMTTPKNTVDVRVKVGSEEINLQKLPAEMSIADSGTAGMVVSESRDAMLNEIEAFQGISERILADTDRHQAIVEACKGMKTLLDPGLAREAEQAKEIEQLKQNMASLTNDMSDIKSMLSQALHGKKEELT